MKLVYVAGPYRAPTENGVYENIQRARAVALAVLRAGAFPVCPHMLTAFMGGAAPDEVFLAGDLLMLEKCAAVVLVERWEDSSGTLTEIRRAEELGIPVYRSVGEFEAAARQRVVCVAPDPEQARRAMDALANAPRGSIASLPIHDQVRINTEAGNKMFQTFVDTLNKPKDGTP